MSVNFRSTSFFLWVALCCVLIAAGWRCEPVPQSAVGQGTDAPKNIVVFIADDHGKDTGAYGNPVIKTPHLDALAAEGTLFTHAFATTASCSASRSVILSGLHNHRSGQYGHTHDYHHFKTFQNLRTLPLLLSEAGYRTARAGKYHVTPEEIYPFEVSIPGNSRNAVEMADNARAFLSEDDGPFFLYMGTSDPHRGRMVEDEALKERFKDLRALPDDFGNRVGGYDGITPVTYDPADVIVPPWLPDTPATRAELIQYYESISRVDQGFGYLVDMLKELGHYENTLIVYMSDHGIAMPGAKTTVYEPGLQSPLIVRHPDANERGIVSSAMISWVDIAPTLLDFAGVDGPTYERHISNPEILRLVDFPETHGLHGRSFLPVLEQEQPAGWDEVYASHTFHEIQMYYPMRVVRDRNYKLIWNIAHGLPYPFATDLWVSATWQEVYQQGTDQIYGVKRVLDYIYRPEFELYDMQADPFESTNLASNPEFEDVLSTYKEKMKAFQARTSDPWAMKWYYQ